MKTRERERERESNNDNYIINLGSKLEFETNTLKGKKVKTTQTEGSTESFFWLDVQLSGCLYLSVVPVLSLKGGERHLKWALKELVLLLKLKLVSKQG